MYIPSNIMLVKCCQQCCQHVSHQLDTSRWVNVNIRWRNIKEPCCVLLVSVSSVPKWKTSLSVHGIVNNWHRLAVHTYTFVLFVFIIILLHFSIMLQSKERVTEELEMLKAAPAVWDKKSKKYRERNLKSHETSKIASRFRTNTDKVFTYGKLSP